MNGRWLRRDEDSRATVSLGMPRLHDFGHLALKTSLCATSERNEEESYEYLSF